MAALRPDIERTRSAARARELFDRGELKRIIDGAVEKLEVPAGPAAPEEFPDLSSDNPPPPRPFKLRPANLNLREIRAIRWVIQGWVAAGEIVTFAGLPGVGKSTAFAGLTLVVAGFGRAIGSNLRNDRPRRVVIVSEHAEQYQRLLHASIKRHGLDPDAVADAIELFDAVRLKTAEIAREIAHLVEEHRTDSEPPLVILDTASSLFALEDENSNAEVAGTIAALKGTVTATGAAIWIVAHAAKAFSREDSDITPRGASAFMGDVHGTGSVFRDTNTPGSVFVKSIKNRSVVEFSEIEAAMETVTLEAVDERGVVQQLPVRIATPVVPFIDRASRKAEARAAEAQDELSHAKAFIGEFIDQRPGVNVSRRMLEVERGELSREVIRQAIEAMLRRGDLLEEEIRPRPDKGARHRLTLRELA
jgi:RecA-family ATPase